jgi:anti-sigma-K factor RskA
MTDLRRDRLLELLADQTIFGLSAEELVELKTLKKQFPEWEKDFSLELAATAIGLSNLDVSEDLPANLRARIFANADEFFIRKEESEKVASAALPVEKTIASSTAESADNAAAAPNRPFWHWLGWGLAAASCVTLAFIIWSTRDRNQPEIVNAPETVQTPETVQSPEVVQIPETVRTPEAVKTPEIAQIPEPAKTPESVVKSPEPLKTPEPTRNPKTAATPEVISTPEPVKTPAPVLTAAQRREQLIASAPDVIQTNWTSAKDDKRVLGDVVWSNAQQKGYIRLRGMPALNAGKETYQLWIVDDERDEKTPVSAGLFSVSGTGEIIVPINAQLRIIKPKQFAITKEKAGGVVVSKPDRIVAVAKI